MDLRSTSDEDLVYVPKGADGAAGFGELYRRYERFVLAFFVRRGMDAETAADLMSETFAAALTARRRFRPDGNGSAARWLFAIAAHVLSRHHRHQGAERRRAARMGLVRPALDDPALRAIEAATGTSAVLAAMESLPQAQREAVRAHVVEEHSYPQIAADSGADEATIRKRVSRGLRSLRRSLEEGS